MSALREVDRDLDQIVVDAARLTDVRKGVAARGKLTLAAADTELAALGEGAPVVARQPVRAAPAASTEVAADEEESPPSGQIDVPDDVLSSAELPAVLAIQPAYEPLSLDPDSGETGLDDEIAPVATSASMVLPAEMVASAEPAHADPSPPTETRSLIDPGIDDMSTDLASLLGDSDPMRDEGAVPLAPAEIEPEPTMMFSAEDAERFSRPAPPLLDELEGEGSDVELDLDEVIEIEEDEPAEVAPRPKTAPPPPPRTAPPPPPGTPGFLGKLLQRKP